MSGTARGAANARKLYKYAFDGFSRTDEAGKLRVVTSNAEISASRAAYSACALESVVLKGDGTAFPAGIGKILRAATPAEIVDGVKYEDAIAVTEDFSVYRYEPNTEVYYKPAGIALTCVPTVVPYLSAEKDEYAVLFGGQAAGIRAGGTVKIFAASCYKNFGCAAFERVFFAADEKTVKYSGVLDPADQSDSADEGGHIVLPASSGMRGMCAFGKHVYVFFEREIYRIDARGAAREFSAERLAYGGGEIYENSAFACGSKLCFTTDEGVVAYDGSKFTNVTERRSDFCFFALKFLHCAGAAGRYVCGFGQSAATAKTILYHAENGAVSEIPYGAETVCAYGERLFVYDEGAEKEFLFGKRAADGNVCRMERADEDFSAAGVKTLKRVTVYGSGTAKLTVSGADGAREYELVLSENGACAEVNESAEKFSFALELSGGATATGAAAEVYAFER